MKSLSYILHISTITKMIVHCNVRRHISENPLSLRPSLHLCPPIREDLAIAGCFGGGRGHGYSLTNIWLSALSLPHLRLRPFPLVLVRQVGCGSRFGRFVRSDIQLFHRS